jgi:hypothetical protein
VRRLDESILVITNGCLASLLACLIAESEVGGTDGAAASTTRLAITPWLAPEASGLFPVWADAKTVRRFVQLQAETMSLQEVVATRAVEAGPLACSELLLRAAAQATTLGCRRVIWPIALGNDLDAVHIAAERALAVTQLAALDAPEGANAPLIETPFLDFTPTMLAQLAMDLDAPLSACWLTEPELAAFETGAGAPEPAFAGV